MKRALVLSGGGSKGAYQLGVLQHLVACGDDDYEIVCGVSVGALNGALLASHELGTLDEAVNELTEFWQSITTSSIHKRWFPFGKLHGLWKGSFYDSSPLQRLVKRRISRLALITSGRNFAVGAVNLNTGSYQIFTQTHPCIVDAVLASSAFPAMLSPVKIMGDEWTDGGVRDVTPIKAAIDMGADTIDVIMCTPSDTSLLTDRGLSAIQIAARSIDVMSDEIIANDIEIAQLINKFVSFGHSSKKLIPIRIFRPSRSLSMNALEFKHEMIKEAIELGRKDAAVITAV